MKNKISTAVLLIVFFFIAGAGYIYFKKSDYAAAFEISVAPGIGYQKVLHWEFDNFRSEELVEKTPFQSIEQEVISEGILFELNWSFRAVNDSITRVELEANSINTSFGDKFNLLFRKSGFSEKLKSEVGGLQNSLIADKEVYKVTIDGKALSPETTCACISLKSEIDKKAFEMMASINELSNFVLQNDLETTGRPRVIIQKWDLEGGFINFDFCFPLKGDKKPDHPVIFFKNIPAVPSLKATFHGNYMLSHMAWFELLNYAEQNNIEVKPLPQEIFHNNPELGGDSNNWKAEIFLPLIP